MKNQLVHRLHEEVDLFMMSPECTPALCHLDNIKEQLEFHHHRTSQYLVDHAAARLRELPVGASAGEVAAIVTWAQCVGYELMCEFLQNIIQEISKIRNDAVLSHQPQQVMSPAAEPIESQGTEEYPADEDDAMDSDYVRALKTCLDTQVILNLRYFIGSPKDTPAPETTRTRNLVPRETSSDWLAQGLCLFILSTHKNSFQ